MKIEADSPETVVAGVRHGVVVWNKPSLRVPDVRQHRWVELLLLLLYLLLLLLHSLLLLHLLHLFLLLLEKESILAAPQCKIRLGLLPRSGAFPLLTLCSEAKKKKLYMSVSLVHFFPAYETSPAPTLALDNLSLQIRSIRGALAHLPHFSLTA